MSTYTGYWQLVTPKTRKQLYTTVATDAYDPRHQSADSASSITWYSQVMKGPGSRMQTYKQYDSMDGDIDIARSLDIIAEEMSGRDEKTDLPFEISWQTEDNQDITDSTIVTVRAALRQWSQLQDFKKRLFSISRCMIKYGDCLFVKISDTKKWQYIDMSNVVGIRIDQDRNKVSYQIRKPTENVNSYSIATTQEVMEVPASAVIHFTLSDDMGDSAPYGQSILRPIFRVYRQFSMLEDAAIIYKIVRAPERRVFYIDVGNSNPQQVKRYLESVKNEMRQRRSPTSYAGAKESVDGQVDVQSMQEDFFFPVTAAGRSSKVETLPGGSEDFGNNLLKQFQDKIFRGLRIPTSYMSGQEGQGAQSNDGKVGIAYIEELRFAKFISRQQDRMNEVLDAEFKIYLKVCGLKIDDELFNIKLPDPANFALYRQAALDADLISSFQNIQEVKFLSRRFILKRYLGLSDDEIQMNEIQMKEERDIKETSKVSSMQQMYDPAVYESRDSITVDTEGVGGGEPTAGMEVGDLGDGGDLKKNTGFEDTEPGPREDSATGDSIDLSAEPNPADKATEPVEK